MSKALFKTKVFFKRNSSTVLTCIAGVGVVVTTVMAVKATPKAMTLLEEAKREKGDDLTTLETVVTAAPAYIPTVLVGASTIACIFGANVLNKRQQAALTSAYALLDNSYKEFRKKVDELYGEGSVAEVKEEIAKDQYANNPIRVSEGMQLFYDDYSGRLFESTMENVLRAEYEINKILSTDTGAFLNEFYEFLKIDTVEYGDYLGWSAYEMAETKGDSWLDFRHEKVLIDDDLECTMIVMMYEPMYEFYEY
jgi:hypothetical protein